MLRTAIETDIVGNRVAAHEGDMAARLEEDEVVVVDMDRHAAPGQVPLGLVPG